MSLHFLINPVVWYDQFNCPSCYGCGRDVFTQGPCPTCVGHPLHPNNRKPAMRPVDTEAIENRLKSLNKAEDHSRAAQALVDQQQEELLALLGREFTGRGRKGKVVIRGEGGRHLLLEVSMPREEENEYGETVRVPLTYTVTPLDN